MKRRITAALVVMVAILGGAFTGSAVAVPSSAGALNQNPNMVNGFAPWTAFQGNFAHLADNDSPDGFLAASRSTGTYMTVNNETAPTTLSQSGTIVSEAGIRSSGPVGAQYILKIREKTPAGALVRDAAGPTETIAADEIGDPITITGPSFAAASGNKLDARLSIYATAQQSDVDWIRYSFVNQAPTANFTFSPASPVAPASIDFTSTSTDPEGFALACDYDLNGDGLYDEANTCNVQGEFFENPGTYDVGLRVTDLSGATDVERKTITVTAPPSQSPATAPTGFVWDEASTTGDKCVWEWNDNPAAEGIDTYQGYNFTGPTTYAGNYTDVTVSRFEITGLSPGTTRYLKVGAANELGFSPWTPASPNPAIACTTDAVVPPPPPPPGDSAEDRPYDPNYSIYSLFDASVPLDPNSAAISSRINSTQRGFTLGTDGESPPIYRGLATHNLYTGCGYSFRAPGNMVGGGGSDNPLQVFDTTTKRSHRFWQANVNNTSRTISSSGCSVSLYGQQYGHRGRGEVDGSSPTGSGFEYSVGAIRPVDFVRGRIDHAIRYAVNGPRHDFRYPAKRIEGQNPNPGTSGVGMGYRVKLAPSVNMATVHTCINNTAGLDTNNKRAGRIIATGLQEYGLLAGDGTTSADKLLYMEGSATAGYAALIGARNSSGSYNHIGRAIRDCLGSPTWQTAASGTFLGGQ